MKKEYMVIGSWGLKPGPKGINIFAYDRDTADLTFEKTMFGEICVGCLFYDRNRNVLYVTDESDRIENGAAQGFVQPFSVGGEEILTPVKGAHTLLPKPSACRLDKTGRFLLVAHHSGRGTVTRLVRTETGYTSEAVPDEAALMSFSVTEDGGVRELLDVCRTVGEEPYSPHAISHEHCTELDPTGRMFLVCDKGLDQIGTYRLSEETGKLVPLSTVHVETGWMPRLAVFHPTLPFVYVNYEHAGILSVFRYDASTGVLAVEKHIETGTDGMGLGLSISPDGRYLYISMKEPSEIISYAIDEDGMLEELSRAGCGGENPRSIFVTPDGRFLFCANTGSDMVTKFRLDENGIPQMIGMNIGIRAAANFALITVEEPA